MAEAAKLGKIFIGGLSYETTDDKLRAYFGAYGAVTDAVVMKDPISRRSRGFGFITYADPACVDRALAQPTHILDSRRVEAKRAVPRAESLRDIGNGSSSTSSSPLPGRGSASLAISSMSGVSGAATKKIFVGGLHYETKDADFRKYFAQFGKVVSAEVMFNRETNKSRGFGFVVFESEASVEVVLQEKNHVIDGKSVEVKRAVPRTDVPPPRSVSSRAGSFGGPGPGSVGSLDELNSTATTPPVSLSGSVPSTSSLANHPLESLANASSSSRSAAANLMASGTLVGYAAAVRYGSRSMPKGVLSSSPLTIPSSVGSPTPPSRNGTESNGLGLDSSTMDGVADALSSLVLGEPTKSRSRNGASPLHSASSSSLGSLSDKLAVSGSASNGGLSPLDVALSPLSDPVMEQWKLSPASTARGSADLTSLSASEANYLSHGLLDDDVTSSTGGSTLSWQAPAWQQPWHSPPLHRSASASDSQQPPLPPAPQSLYSMFSSSGSGRGPSWHNGYSDHLHAPTAHVNGSGASSSVSDGFGGGVMSMGMGLPVDGGYGGAFGRTESSGHDANDYSSLGGLLGGDYLSSSSQQQMRGGAFSLGGGLPEEDDHHHQTLYDKNDHDLAYDLPASAAEYHRQFR